MRRLAVFALLPNAVFAVLSPFVFLQHPLVNVDYLVVWALAGWLSGAATGLLYGFCLLLDALVSAEGIYEFSTADALANAQYLAQLDLGRVLAVAGLLLACIAGLALLAVHVAGWRGGARAPRHVRIPAAIAAALLTVATPLSLLELWRHPLDPGTEPRFAGSRAVEVVESAAAAALGTRPVYAGAEWRGRTLLRDLAAVPAKAPPYNVVLVLVESDGLLRNERDEARVLAPLTGKEVARRYKVASGVQRFSGSTLAGELRALCGLRGPAVDAETARALPPCLPKLLARRGFETLSFHGNSGRFFDRERWYPQLGFDLTYFAEQMQITARRPLAECGTLIHGICDLEFLGTLRRELAPAAPKQKFLYWLTLSSHLPVDEVLARDSTLDCEETASLPPDSPPCGLARILHTVHRRIAALALDPAIAPTRFIVVGDHAPVFPVRADRDLYDEARVPFVDLVPL